MPAPVVIVRPAFLPGLEVQDLKLLHNKLANVTHILNISTIFPGFANLSALKVLSWREGEKEKCADVMSFSDYLRTNTIWSS